MAGGGEDNQNLLCHQTRTELVISPLMSSSLARGSLAPDSGQGMDRGLRRERSFWLREQ